MSGPLIASSLLAELRRLLSAQDAMALMPPPTLDMWVGTMGVDSMSAAAIVDMQQEISALLTEATDAALVRAYQEIAGEPAGLDAEAVFAEIERRNLKI